MSERNELILFAVWDEQRRRPWFKTAERSSFIPSDDVFVLGFIDREDRSLMIQWARDQRRRGWSLRKIRQAVEGPKRP